MPSPDEDGDGGAPMARVLVVDADAVTAASTAAYLRARGRVVSVLANGKAALRELHAEHRPAVVVLDLSMPDMSGWQFRAAQKRDPSVADIPVIAVAPKTSDEAWALDARALLVKPVDLAQLEAEIERALLGSAVVHRLAPATNLGLVALGTAHELNNVLTCLLANLEETERGLRSEASDVGSLIESTAAARQAGARLAAIVRDLQRTYRPGAGDRRADVPAAIDSAVKITAHRIRTRARLSVRLEQTPAARMSQSQLEQVLVNLLINAVHALPASEAVEGEITITTARGDDRVSIEVHDTGSGIPTTVQPRIFEPFFTTKGARHGSGIGLWLSRSLVKNAGGELSFQSRPGEGTTFRVDLPLAGPTKTTPAESTLELVDLIGTEPPRPAHDPGVGPAGAGVLVVEPDARVRCMFADVLQREGYHAMPVATANEAMRLLEHVRPDLVLTSLRLGDMNGAQFLARLKRDARLADVPSLVVTGAGRDEANACLASEAVSTTVVEKPVRVATLLATIRSVVSAGSKGETSAASFG